MLRNLRWVIVFLLFLLYMIHYLDRSALSIAVPMIEKDIDISPEQFGIIFGSFFAGYAVFNFLGGIASDKFGPKIVLGAAIGLWSIFCGLTAFATGFWSMLVLRVLFGMAEGPVCSVANKITSGWFSKKQAATAVGIFSAGSPLGGAIAGPVVGYLALAFGWREAFLIISSIGLIWMVIWFFISADNPSRSKRVTEEERAYIMQQKAQETQGEAAISKTTHSLSYYMKHPVILATAFAFFAYNYILYFFLSWFPVYLVKAQGLDIKQMSITTMIPWILGFIGLALSGILSDKIYRVTGRLLFSRKIILVISLLITAACIAITGTVKSAVPAVALMSVSIFFLYLTGAIYWAIIQDVVDQKHVGAAGGFIHMIGNLSGIVGPTVTGFIVQKTGHFDSAFVLAGVICAVGAVLAFWIIKAPKGRDSDRDSHTSMRNPYY